MTSIVIYLRPMFRAYLLLFISILFSERSVAQSLYPILFKPLPPPMVNLYYLQEIGLMGVANHQEIQLWDVKSRAYYGVISVVPPEFVHSHILHVEYIKDRNRIAIVFESLTTDVVTNSTRYTDYFYLYDANTLLADSANRNGGAGMSQLLKYKYKEELPVLKDKDKVYRYNMDTVSGQLLTVDREGEVNIYGKGKWIKKVSTNAKESQLVCVAREGNSFYVTDISRGVLMEFSIVTGKLIGSVPLEFIPNQARKNNVYGANHLFSVTAMPSEHSICVLDSVNRMRIVDTKTAEITTYRFSEFYDQTIVAMAPNWTDSSLYIIGEGKRPPYARVSFYTNLKTGITNSFSGGTAPYISAASSTGLKDKFRMIVSGLNELEVDLKSLTEKTISQFPIGYSESMLLAGNWEDGSFQLLQTAAGEKELRVFKSDSVKSYLLYTQPVQFREDETLAGIFPEKKSWITVKSTLQDNRQQLVNIYDSTGKLLKTIEAGIPLQTVAITQLHRQHLFSPDGNYFMLKEISKQAFPMDSCRLRIYATDDFALIADLRFTEMADFNPFNHRTATFRKDTSGFFFITTTQSPAGVVSTSLHHYILTGKQALKRYETKLCLDKSCSLGSAVRNIQPSMDGEVLLWNGFVPSNSANNREGYQYVIFTKASTGEHYTGVNLQPLPELVNVLPFKGYIGLQYMERIEMLQFAANVTGPFVTLSPYVNDQTYDLSMVYTTFDPLTKEMWYYEKTNNDDCISFRVGTSSFRRKQFDINYNRPDLVLSKVPGYDTLYRQLYYKAVSKRTERIPNKLQSFKPASMPVVILEKTGYLSNNDFSIRVKTISPVAVQLYYIMINGNRIEQQTGGNLSSGVTFTVSLTNGDNVIEIVAVNKDGVESLPLRLSQNHSRTSIRPNLYVLAASVGKYRKGLDQLPFAVKDGRDIASLMKGLSADTVFRNIIVDTLFDGALDRASLLKWIKGKRTIKPADYVMVFYSGHGFLDSNLNLCLATSVTDSKDPVTSSIDYASVVQEMDLLPARQKLLLIDACHSGDFDRSAVTKTIQATNKDSADRAKGLVGEGVKSGDNSFEVMQNIFSFSEPGKGTVVISAAGGTQSAFEAAKYQNGYFTYALKEAIRDGKASDDPYKRLWLNQLIRYVKQRVTTMSDGRQVPNLRISNPDLNWRIR